jgi:hypothetical protein
VSAVIAAASSGTPPPVSGPAQRAKPARNKVSPEAADALRKLPGPNVGNVVSIDEACRAGGKLGDEREQPKRADGAHGDLRGVRSGGDGLDVGTGPACVNLDR